MSMLARRPVWVADWAVPEYARGVRELAQNWAPDIVQIEYPVMAQYVPSLAGCPAGRVLVEHEPSAAAARDIWRLRRGSAKLMAYLDMLAWKRYERHALLAVNATIVFTERDRRLLAALVPEARIEIIPLGTACPECPLDPCGSLPPRLLFVGSFIHPPNVDAALRLAGTLFPRIQAAWPGVHLQIVGENPPAALHSLTNLHVTVTGRVADVRPYLDQAAVVLAPLRLGGGMRVKVLEALAAGKAVVASPLAVEGIDVKHGEQILIAEHDDQVVAATVHLLADPVRRGELGRRARAWALEHLGWGESVAGYEAVYTRLVEARE